MARQNNRNSERDRKVEGTKRDAASTAIRYAPQARDHRSQNREIDREISLNRSYYNDLYERSSI